MRLTGATIIIFILTCMMLSSFPDRALADSGAEYIILRTSFPPKIDGVLDDIAWKYASPAEIALTNQRTKAKKKSLAYGVYDEDFLYFAFHRFDKDLNKLMANAKSRDGRVWEDDEFELFLDTNHDHTTYWQLCLNVENVQFDCRNSGGGCQSGENTNWETATSKGRSEDWFAEVKVAFKDLGVNETPKPGDVWGVNFCGHVKSGIDEWVTWSDIGASFHNPSGFGNMIFSKESVAVGPAGKLPILWGWVKHR
jgi:hypothetical protein